MLGPVLGLKNLVANNIEMLPALTELGNCDLFPFPIAKPGYWAQDCT